MNSKAFVFHGLKYNLLPPHAPPKCLHALKTSVLVLIYIQTSNKMSFLMNFFYWYWLSVCINYMFLLLLNFVLNNFVSVCVNNGGLTLVVYFCSFEMFMKYRLWGDLVLRSRSTVGEVHWKFICLHSYCLFQWIFNIQEYIYFLFLLFARQ